MAIDFGLLTPQPAPRSGVIATIPNQPSALDSLAGGIMQGAQTGTNIMAARQNMAVQQQQMDQSAQAFPSLLQKSQNDAASSSLDLQKKQGEMKSAKEVSDAFHQNWNAGMAQMAKNDPAGYLALQKTTADTQKVLQETANLATTNKKESVALYDDFTNKGFQLAQAAAAAEHKQPGSGQAVYQQGLKMLGDTVASQLPQQFNSQTFHALTYLGADSQLRQMKEAEAKNGTNETKNAARVGALQDKVSKGQATDAEKAELSSLNSQIGTKNQQTLTDLEKTQTARNNLEQKIQQGQGTEQDKRDLNELNSKIKASSRGAVNSPTDIAVGKAREAQLNEIRKSNTAITDNLGAIDRAEAALSKTPQILLNPVADFLGLGRLNKDAQVLASNLNDQVLSYKNIQNMGSQGFTDADRKFVIAVKGGLGNFKGSLKELLGASRSMSEHRAVANYLDEDKVMRHSSEYDDWKKTTKEPQAKVINKDGVRGTVPASHLDEALKEGYKQE